MKFISVQNIKTGQNGEINVEHIVSITDAPDKLGLWSHSIITDCNNEKWLAFYSKEDLLKKLQKD